MKNGIQNAVVDCRCQLPASAAQPLDAAQQKWQFGIVVQPSALHCGQIKLKDTKISTERTESTPEWVVWRTFTSATGYSRNWNRNTALKNWASAFAISNYLTWKHLACVPIYLCLDLCLPSSARHRASASEWMRSFEPRLTYIFGNYSLRFCCTHAPLNSEWQRRRLQIILFIIPYWSSIEANAIDCDLFTAYSRISTSYQSIERNVVIRRLH